MIDFLVNGCQLAGNTVGLVALDPPYEEHGGLAAFDPPYSGIITRVALPGVGRRSSFQHHSGRGVGWKWWLAAWGGRIEGNICEKWLKVEKRLQIGGFGRPTHLGGQADDLL